VCSEVLVFVRGMNAIGKAPVGRTHQVRRVILVPSSLQKFACFGGATAM
jgi:hypothetical protein